MWVSAQIKLCDLAFIPVVVKRKGDPDAGQVIIIRDLLHEKYEVFSQTIEIGGSLGWRRTNGSRPIDHMAVYTILQKELKFDPDIWILEIEDPDRRYEFDAPIIH